MRSSVLFDDTFGVCRERFEAALYKIVQKPMFDPIRTNGSASYMYIAESSCQVTMGIY